ncbi:MAG TPA: DUF4349 domain-containing protein [Candidatus Baltobacteraceae bacterium]|jgi:hypothetical protein|nr:DUF4349 domain-containing protein [Candidatus Baltobacteraceae bacterium]
MRKVLTNLYPGILRNPVVTFSLAIAIVLGLGSWAASQLHTQPAAFQGPEKIAVTKSIVTYRAQPAMDVATGSEQGVPMGQGAPAATPAPAPASAIAQPQIARTGKISLFVNDVARTVRQLSRIGRRYGGDVFSLNVSNEDDRTAANAQMELRVPAGAFDRTMDEAARLGKVRERSSSAEDLTGDITDSSARLRNLRQTEADIRAIMDRSGNVSQVMDAENQLSSVREQIETLESSIASMRGRVTYSTIDLDVQAEIAAQPVEPTAASQLANAWHGAVHALSQTAIALISLVLWVIVFVPVIAATLLIAYSIVAVVRRARHGPETNPRGA